MFWPHISLWFLGGPFVLGSFPVCRRVANVTTILWNAGVCFQPHSSLIGKVFALDVMPFCVWHTPYRMLWRWGMRLEWFRSTSVLLWKWSTIKAFSSSSALLEFEVRCCLFCYSFSLTGHSMLWWMVVVANSLTWW